MLNDINNSLKILTPKGVIVTHDTLLFDECQRDASVSWNAWEAFATLRTTNSNIFMASVKLSGDSVGCGVIKHGTQTLYGEPIPVSWSDYLQSRNKLMNIQSIETILMLVEVS